MTLNRQVPIRSIAQELHVTDQARSCADVCAHLYELGVLREKAADYQLQVDGRLPLAVESIRSAQRQMNRNQFAASRLAQRITSCCVDCGLPGDMDNCAFNRANAKE